MDNKPANIALGVIALTADLLGIAGFILSGDVTKFWSATWIVYVFGLTLLLGVAFFFFSRAKDKRVAAFYPLAAGIYALLSCLAISGLFLGSSAGKFDIGNFVGMLILSLFPAVMALEILSMSPKPRPVAMSISYLYATSGIVAVIFLLFRYARVTGYSWSMLSEFIGLVLIGAGFLVFANEKT